MEAISYWMNLSKKKNSLISLGVGNDIAFDLDFLREK